MIGAVLLAPVVVSGEKLLLWSDMDEDFDRRIASEALEDLARISGQVERVAAHNPPDSDLHALATAIRDLIKGVRHLHGVTFD